MVTPKSGFPLPEKEPFRNLSTPSPTDTGGIYKKKHKPTKQSETASSAPARHALNTSGEENVSELAAKAKQEKLRQSKLIKEGIPKQAEKIKSIAREKEIAKQMLVKEIPKQARLFEASRNLARESATTPLREEEALDSSANPVFLEDEGIYKPGSRAAVFNKACDGVARIIGLGDSLPPAKTGKVGYIEEERSDVSYVRQTNYAGDDVLISPDTEEKVEVEIVRPAIGGKLVCKVDGREVPLKEGKGNSGLVFGDPSLEETAIERVAAQSNNFRRITTGGETFLAPEKMIYRVQRTKDDTGYIEVDGIRFKVIEDKEKGTVRLDTMNPSGKRTSDESTIIDTKYARLYDDDGRRILVPQDVIADLEEESLAGDRIRSFVHEGKEFEAVELPERGGHFAIRAKDVKPLKNPLPFKPDTPLALIFDHENGTYYLTPKSNELVIRKEAVAAEEASPRTQAQKPAQTFEYVVVNGTKFEVANNDGEYSLFNREHPGVFQSRVKNIFAPKGAKVGVNITTQNSERVKDFFNRVDKTGFIDAMLLSIIIRPQDGKIDALTESNVLFQAIPENADPNNPDVKLKPILIDLDETMPPSNTYSSDPELTDDGRLKRVHCVRCGLMGFPQARELLTADERARVIEFARRLREKEPVLEGYLKTFYPSKEIGPEHIAALKDVINRTVSFIEEHKNSKWSLENLFFAVFPEYHRQWEMLGNETPARKASFIGYNDETEIETKKRNLEALEKSSKDLKDREQKS